MGRRRRSPSNSPPRRRRSPSDSPPRRKRSPVRRKPSRSRSPVKSRRSYSGSTSPPRKKAGLDLMGKKSNGNSGQRDRQKSPAKAAEKVSSQAKRKPMTDEEKQAKLAEMMANAEWRDKERTERVNKHRREQDKEEEEHLGVHDKNFMTRELARAQSNLTVEGRLTANKYKLQRGHGDMDKNFAKR